MKVIGPSLLLLTGTIWMTACGSSEPRSPLILGSEPAEPSLGLRNLTASQSRALRKVITSAGETCGTIREVLLTDFDPAGGEAWDVQCTEARYSVQLRADGTPGAAVQRCLAGFFGDTRCTEPLMRTMHRERRPPEGGSLNPDLQKLLEPMTAKDGKTD
jgi:hypothetical protein